MSHVLPHFVSGKRSQGADERLSDVYDPNTGVVQAQVAFASKKEVDAAVADAVSAQREGARGNPQRRARVLLRFLQPRQRRDGFAHADHVLAMYRRSEVTLAAREAAEKLIESTNHDR